MKSSISLFLFIICLFGFSCDKSKTTVVIPTTAKGDTLKLNSFVKKINQFEYTQLGIACKENNFEEVQDLVKKGANINIAKKDEIYIYDALYVAIENNHLSIVELLVNNKANINQTYTEDGLTPLSLACKLNLYEIAKSLIEKGADINGTILPDSDYIITPLFMGLENNNFKLTKLIVEGGADVNIKDETNKSAKDLGLKKGGKWSSLFNSIKTKNINSDTETKWQGIYYYHPYVNTDSLGNYYINIKANDSEFGFSGAKSFIKKLNVDQKFDTLFVYDKVSSSLLGKILKKNNQFWIISSYFKKRKKEDINLKMLPLNYAKSSDNIE